MPDVIRSVVISKCARCGEDHLYLEFQLFQNPVEDSDGTIWNYWGMCPTTKEPILMKIIDGDEDHLDPIG